MIPIRIEVSDSRALESGIPIVREIHSRIDGMPPVDQRLRRDPLQRPLGPATNETGDSAPKQTPGLRDGCERPRQSTVRDSAGPVLGQVASGVDAPVPERRGSEWYEWVSWKSGKDSILLISWGFRLYPFPAFPADASGERKGETHTWEPALNRTHRTCPFSPPGAENGRAPIPVQEGANGPGTEPKRFKGKRSTDAC
jgi:hypothetical protein